MKSLLSTTVHNASPVSGSDLPKPSTMRARLVGEASSQVTSTNSLPPASYIARGGAAGPPRAPPTPPGGGRLPHGEPQGLHGVGHHLLVTDGDVDVVLSVAGRRNREQRCDGPALDDLEAVVHQAPFDVLRAAEVRFDAPAQLSEPHDLLIRQRRLALLLR